MGMRHSAAWRPSVLPFAGPPSRPRVSRLECLEDRSLLSSFVGSPPNELGETLPVESSCEATSMPGRLFSLHIEGDNGQIYEVRPDSGIAINSFDAPESIGTPGYQGLALGPDSLFFVDGSGNGPHTLYELDSTTGAVIDSDLVDDLSDPPVTGLACLDDLVYLGRSGNDSLLIWDPVADLAVGTLGIDFAIGGGLTGAAELGVLFNSNGSGDVISIAPDDGRVLQQFPTSSYSFSGGLAYVDGELLGGNFSTGKIYRINPATGAVFGSFDSPGSGKLTGLAGDGAASDPGEVRGGIWNDANGDRLWNNGESGSEGWTVFLDSDQDGALDPEELSAVTDASGMYCLGDVPPGTHFLAEIIQPGWTQTFPGQTPSQGRLFALWIDDATDVGTIVELDPNDGTVVNDFAAPGEATRPGVQGLAVGPDRLYYVESDSLLLHELGLDTGAVIESHALTLPYGESISGLAYLDGLLYLVQHDAERIFAWDPDEETIVSMQTFAAIDLDGSLTGVADEGLLFCGNSSGDIFAIDPQLGTVERSLSTGLGQFQGGMAYLNGELIVCAFGTSVAAHRLDPISGTSLGTLPLEGSQYGLLTGLAGDGAVGATEAGTHVVEVSAGLVVENLNFGNQQNNSAQSVFATSGDDVITFTTSDTAHVVVVNGESFSFDASQVEEIHIDGLEGNDQITVIGSHGDENVTLQPGSVDVAGPGYAIDADNVETIHVDADTGSDHVTMTASAGSNRLYSYADYSRLSDSTRSFSHRVEGFETLVVDAPGDGRDYAFLYDSPDNDVLEASPVHVQVRREDNSTTRTATGFQRAYVYATGGGNDTATLTGPDTTRNRFYSYADYSILTESRRSFYFYARDFDSVTAQSPSSGSTYAYLYDSPGIDSFDATPTYAVMDRADPWSDTRTEGFSRVYAYSTRGGDDSATLQGRSVGGNNLRAYPAYSTLTDQSRSFYHYARGFRWMTAEGSASDPSGDRAYMYDSPEDDIFYDDGQYAYLQDTAGLTFQNRVRYFDLIYARSSDRDTEDTIDIDPEQELAYQLIRSGTW